MTVSQSSTKASVIPFGEPLSCALRSGWHTKQCTLQFAPWVSGSLAVQDNTEKGLVDFDFAVVLDEA